VQVLAQIENLVDKLLNPNLNPVSKQVIKKILTSSMLLLQSLDQQAHPGVQYPAAAQHCPPAWDQLVKAPVQLFPSAHQTCNEVAAVVPEVTPANGPSV
jgi:hypothetical protein